MRQSYLKPALRSSARDAATRETQSALSAHATISNITLPQSASAGHIASAGAVRPPFKKVNGVWVPDDGPQTRSPDDGPQTRSAAARAAAAVGNGTVTKVSTSILITSANAHWHSL